LATGYRPREKALRVVQRELTAEAARNEIEPVLGPGNLEECRARAGRQELLVQPCAESRVDHVVASPVDEQGRRQRARHICQRRRFMITGWDRVRRAIE